MANRDSKTSILSSDTDDAAGWNRLLPPLVDKLVTVIKQNGRWPDEGRDLRSLNKHWCKCINSSITRVRPATDVTICSEDVQSLLKFPNLESVDILTFLAADHEFKYSVVSGESRLDGLDEEQQKQRLVNVLTVLTQAKNLRELFLDKRLQVMKKRIWMDREVSDLMKKLQVKSIVYGDSPRGPQLPDDIPSQFSTRWALKDWMRRPPESLDRLLTLTPLKKLNISSLLAYTPQLHQSIVALGKSCVKSLHLFIDLDLISLDNISEVENVEVLSLLFSHYGDLRPLSKMKSLKYIEICLEGRKVHMHPEITFKSIIENWTEEICFVSKQVKPLSLSLGLLAKRPGLDEKDLANGLATVKCLRIRDHFGMGTSNLELFPNIEVLDLGSATLENKTDLWFSLDRSDKTIRRIMMNLKWLILPEVFSYSEVALKSIFELRNLEFLSLKHDARTDIQSLNSLSQLKSLRHLELRCHYLGGIYIRPLHTVKVLEHLDTLGLLVVWCHPDLPDAINTIARSFPQLKIVNERLPFEETYKMYSE